jgi:CheY-like chemotaxis protein
MSYKLLLADDSITIQKVVGIIFANEDYDLTVVDNGNLAVEKAKELKPDMVLIDALMPGKTGYEVCEEVRRDPTLEGTPLLLLTGAFEPFDEDKAKKSGADDFISKPFESQHLIDKVKKLIELGKTRKKANPAVSAAVAAPPVTPAPAIAQPIPTPAPAAVAKSPMPQTAPKATPPPVKPSVQEVAELPSADEFIVEEVEADDDLWGTISTDKKGDDDAFFFEEPVVQATPAKVAPIVPAKVDESAFGVESTPEVFDFGAAAAPDPFAEESFAFEEEALEPIPEVEATTAVPTPSPFSEREFEFPEDPFAEPIAVKPASVAPASIPPARAAARPVAPPPFASEDQYISPDSSVSIASPSVPPVSGGSATGLSEEQLATVVSQVSKAIIEKIAWEVVPDLAETIIKEEIRKIKIGK